MEICTNVHHVLCCIRPSCNARYPKTFSVRLLRRIDSLSHYGTRLRCVDGNRPRTMGSGGHPSHPQPIFLGQGLLSRKFELSGEASAAAGPVGRHASAGTDWKMDTEALSYSRSKGLFAG